MGCSFQFVYTEKKPAGLKNQQSWCLLKKIYVSCLWFGFVFQKDLKIVENDRIRSRRKPHFIFQLFKPIKKMSENDRDRVLKESFISPKRFRQIKSEKDSS